jgi:hypothetical protein
MSYQKSSYQGYGGGDARRRAGVARLNEVQRQGVQDEIAAEHYADEQKQLGEAKKRQAQYDFVQHYREASNLAEKGDLAGAQALLAPYGATLQDLDSEAAGLKKELGIPAQASPMDEPSGPPKAFNELSALSQQRTGDGPGGSAAPDGGLDGGRFLKAGIEESDLLEYGQAAPSAGDFKTSMRQGRQGSASDLESQIGGIVSGGNKYLDGLPQQQPTTQPMQTQTAGAREELPQGGPSVEQLMQRAAPQAAPQDAQLNPILAGFGKDKERQAAQARRVLSMMSPGGQRVELDPDARRTFAAQQKEEERTRSLAQLDSAFGEAAKNDPAIAKYYPQIRAVIAGSTDPMNSENVLNYIGRRSGEEQAGLDRRSAAELLAKEKEQARLDRLAMFEAGEKGKNRRASAMAGRPLTTAQAADDTRANSAAASALLNQELAKEDYKEQRKALNDSQKLAEQLSSDNPAAQRAALGTWAKLAAGPGTVQQGERDEFVNKVGGKNMQVKKWANEWLNGGRVPEEQKAIFEDAVKNIVIGGYTRRLADIQKGVRTAYETHPDPKMRGYADWATGRVAPGVLPSQQQGAKKPLDLRALARKTIGGK